MTAALRSTLMAVGSLHTSALAHFLFMEVHKKQTVGADRLVFFLIFPDLAQSPVLKLTLSDAVFSIDSRRLEPCRTDGASVGGHT